MKTQGVRHRDRAAILADINAVENAVAGTLTEKRRGLKGGGTAVYHQLQRWEGGRNVTVHVPASRVEAVRAGIEGRRRLDALLAELAAADTAAALSGGAGDPVKKKRGRPSGGSRGGSPGRRPPRPPR
jgi:hypothetical protein